MKNITEVNKILKVANPLVRKGLETYEVIRVTSRKTGIEYAEVKEILDESFNKWSTDRFGKLASIRYSFK